MYNSQWNQDKWLNENIFHNKKNGFFVDIGAHDGITINNTFFYEKELNWKGICIEPIPDIFDKLVNNRKAVCIQGCAYNKNGIVEFNRIQGYSEMLSGIAESYCSDHINRINNEIAHFGGSNKKLLVQAFDLSTLFSAYKIAHVDYMSIDTEGSELQVLEGIDFKNVSIDVIEVEVNYLHDEKKINEFLYSKGYIPKIKLGGDVLYLKK